MTISPNPRIFDLSGATPVTAHLPGAGDPDLQRVFWHGTRVENLEGILRDGLIPGKTLCGHTCLADDPAIALLFARLNNTLKDGEVGSEPVLIRIDGSHLSPDACKLETGSIKISAYGGGMPGRGQNELREANHDWRSLMEAAGVLGYGKVIPVGEHMLERRTEQLPALTLNSLMKEMKKGVPSQRKTIQLLSEINAELMPAMAA